MKTIQIAASVLVEGLLSSSLFASGSFRAQAYAPLKAEIPVFCHAVADPETQIYQISILPENDQIPAPDSDTLSVAENSTGIYEIEITEPGTYRYQISETAGSDPDILYDERIYDVTVFVENGAEDQLVCAVTANAAGRAEKTEQISFLNIAAEVPAETTEATSQSTTATTEPPATVTTTAVTQPGGPIVSIINSIKTGDSFPVRLLCLGICAALTASLSAFLFRRRNSEKEGGK